MRKTHIAKEGQSYLVACIFEPETACGVENGYVTNAVSEVTCKKCLSIIKKKRPDLLTQANQSLQLSGGRSRQAGQAEPKASTK